MNHTIKGFLIVASITSMLVLGATIVPIMQSSFASKKHDFKRAEGDPNTNTNTNTNSADSSSSSTATADNTNNITNSATASQNQEQDACAVAVSCPEGSTTVTSTPPPPTATCNPSTVGGITATPTDGTCTASIPAHALPMQLDAFLFECRSIPGFSITLNDDTSYTCTFPSTPA